MKNIPGTVTHDDITQLKAKLRNAKDRLSREWYRSLLEGVKESPWYHDDNKPSLYRDRYMAAVAVAILAITRGHALTAEGLQTLAACTPSCPTLSRRFPLLSKSGRPHFQLALILAPLAKYPSACQKRAPSLTA